MVYLSSFKRQPLITPIVGKAPRADEWRSKRLPIYFTCIIKMSELNALNVQLSLLFPYTKVLIFRQNTKSICKKMKFILHI